MTPPCQTTDTVDLNMNEPKTADTHFTAIQSFYNGTNIFITGGTGDDDDQIATTTNIAMFTNGVHFSLSLSLQPLNVIEYLLDVH
jgi:hypothetical protein